MIDEYLNWVGDTSVGTDTLVVRIGVLVERIKVVERRLQDALAIAEQDIADTIPPSHPGEA